MDIHKAREADKDQIKNMWVYAFNEGEPFLSWYFDRHWDWQGALVAQADEPYSAYVNEQGEAEPWLCGSLEMVPYTLNLRGRKTPASYIVGVSVLPEVRGRGAATALMRQAMEEQRQRGEQISLLIPFSYAFYRRMGYEPAYGTKTLSCGFSELKPLCADYGRVVRAEPGMYEQLNDLYQEGMRSFNGYILRTRREWDFIFDTLELAGGYVYMVQNDDGQPEGYVIFNKTPRRLRVKELIAQNASAQGALLRFICSHASMYEQVQLDLPESSPLPYLLNNPAVPCTVQPFMAARVLDVSAALASAAFPRQLSLGITDPVLPQNNGVFVCPSGGGTPVRSTTADADAELDIGAFSQMAMGFLSPSQLLALGRLRENTSGTAALLEECYPKQQNSIGLVLNNDL